MTTPVDRLQLAETAFAILVSDLEGHGNVLSPMHRAALMELVDTFAAYSVEEAHGRRAFPLPTGMGKTSAVVAFIAALERLGYAVPVSVAASKVEALAVLYRDLVAHGVPAERIGIKHAVPGAAVASTGNAEHLYQLVTHARIRGGSDFELFGQYKGAPRPLCIYDESLFRADAFAFSELELRLALGALGPLAEAFPDLAQVHSYISEASGVIRVALDSLRVSGDEYRNGVPVKLPARDEVVLEAWAALLGKHRPRLKSFTEVLSQLLAVSQMDLQVLTSEQGNGVVSVRMAVPAALRNVVILDASGPIRELARMDPTMTLVDSFDPLHLKSFEEVEVHQLLAAGGRGAIEQSYSGATKETAALSREVLDIIRRESKADPRRAFLVFSFMKRGPVDVLSQLKADMLRAGIDPDSMTPKGQRRFEFLTWGQHEALNGYEHCETVILAGVLHRNHLDIAASIKGQQGHLKAPTPGDLVRHVVETEVAHCVYQAASRGSCRRVVNGKAKPMHLYLIHRGLKLKTILDKVMPGAQWFYPDPVHLKKAAANGRAAAMLGRLLEYLGGVPDGTLKVSSKAAKATMNLPPDDATAHAFKAAAAALEVDEHGWTREGRSLVRAAVAYGFAT
jgi:hypothetical protein